MDAKLMDEWIENPRDMGEPLDVDDVLYPLRLFNSKAKKLTKTKFVQFILEKARVGEELSSGLSWEEGKPVKFIRNYPDDSAVEQFLLTFRFFWGKENKTSFVNLDSVYPKLPISEEIKKTYSNTSVLYRRFRKEIIRFNLYGRIPREKLVDTFMYGDLSHADRPECVKRLNSWKQFPFMYEELWSKFVFSLALALRLICCVADIHKKAIDDYEREKSQTQGISRQDE